MPHRVEHAAVEERPRALHLAQHLHVDRRSAGDEPRVQDVLEPAMPSGDHAGHVEVVHDRPRTAVGADRSGHVPQRVTIIAAVHISLEHPHAPVEVADQRFGKGERGRVFRREPLPRVRELGLRQFAGGGEPLQRFAGALEEHRIADDRLLLIGCAPRLRVGVHVRDPRGPGLQRRHADRVEQPVDGRLAEWRLLVGKASVLLSQLAVGRFAAVRADLDPFESGKQRPLNRARASVLRKVDFEFGKCALALADAGVAAKANLDVVDRDVAPSVRIAERARHGVTVFRSRVLKELIERRRQRQGQRLIAREERSDGRRGANADDDGEQCRGDGPETSHP